VPPPQPEREPTPRPPSECRVPAAIPEGGGYVQCGDGSYRRETVAACASKLPRAERVEYQFASECWYDAECTAQAHGQCNYGTCFYGCTTDDECGPGAMCYCGDPVGRCVASHCRSNADCPADYPCSTVNPRRDGFSCQSPLDECHLDIECGPTLVACRSNGEYRECVILPG
jgi:hypothetical protein